MATPDAEIREQQRSEGEAHRPAPPPEPTRGDGGPQGGEQQRQARFDTGPRSDDVVLEAPHLKLEELNVEVQASVGVDRVSLGAKGLEAELYLRANLDNVVALVNAAGLRTPRIIDSVAETVRERGSGAQQQEQQEQQQQEQEQQQVRAREAEGERMRGELQSALESARTAYERVAGGELREELREAYDTVRSAYERATGAEGDDDRSADSGAPASESESESAADRAKRFVKSPGGAAGAAVAGAAVGALAGSRGRRQGLVGDLADRASDVPGDVAKAVRRRLG